MSIDFWKMEGGGNDFIIIDNRKNIIKENEKKSFAKEVCNRKFGIGADGLILIEPSETKDFSMRIFNPDGSEPEMCGNGSRCALRFAYENGISQSETEFETKAGIISGEIKDKNVKVMLTPPKELKLDFPIRIDGKDIKISSVNTGVPHAVKEVKTLKKVNVREEGRKIRYHSIFSPKGTNVDFVEWEKEYCRVRVYERGVEDETLACGTGAVACAYVGVEKGILKSPVKVLFTKGKEELKVFVEGKDKVYLEGKVFVSFKGKYKGERYAET